METTPAGTKQASSLNNKKIIVIGAVVIVLLLGAVAFLLMRSSNNSDGGNKIGYSVEASVITDQDALQAAADEAIRNAKEKQRLQQGR